MTNQQTSWAPGGECRRSGASRKSYRDRLADAMSFETTTTPAATREHDGRIKAALIASFSLLTLLASAMLLSVAIMANPSQCSSLTGIESQISGAGGSGSSDNNNNNMRIQRSSGKSQTIHRQRRQQLSGGENEKRNSGAGDMKLESQRAKERRPAAQQSSHQVTKKRFKSSFNLVAQSLETLTAMNSSTNGAQQAEGLIDINNNSRPNLVPYDVNNNTIGSASDQADQTWRRNVTSVNGTIDLSQYGQNDVDRLYGDALLVYLKNFNE